MLIPITSVAEVCDNMNLTRIPNPTQKDLERIQKYNKASECIMDALPIKEGIK
ncbi:MAG: hypothetical protein ACOWWR_07215 [Eubacteriales bacterium]